MKIKKVNNLCKTLTKPQRAVCTSCSSASCSLKPAVNNKVNGISIGKIIKNGLRALVLGIVLYSAYDQFFASKKTSLNIKTLTSDTLSIKNKIHMSDTVKNSTVKSILAHK